MKTLVKNISLVLALAMLIACFAGCGKKNKGNTADVKGNSATDIKISYLNQGFGSEWIQETIKRFEKKYPDYKVDITYTTSNSGAIQTFGMEKIDDTDLYVTVGPGDSLLKYCEPLDSLFDLKAKGEEKTVREKFKDSYFVKSKYPDGKYYTAPYVSAGDLLMTYNKGIFKKYNLTLPRTTGEIASIADKLSNYNIPATCTYKGYGYWEVARYIWYSQYEGNDFYVNNFQACKNEKGESPTIDLFVAKDGKYEILKCMETFLTPEYVLEGSNSEEHTTIQTKYIQGNAAMMFNGGWIENETKTVGNMKDFGAFRLPVLSSMTKKLSTVKNEIDLRNLVTAVDDVLDGKKPESAYKSGNAYKVNGKTVSAADWNHMTEARRTTYGSNFGGMFIPKYSTAKEAAKEFIAYMYSNENLEAVAKNQHYTFGGIDYDKAGVQLDISNWSPLAQDFYNISKTFSIYVANNDINSHKIFKQGGADMWAFVNPVTRLQNRNPNDRRTADQLWDEILKTINKEYLYTWMVNITE